MKTIQITLDEALLNRIDSQCGQRNRSSFFRQAALMLLKQAKVQALENKHKQGYKNNPVKPGEFDIWDDEQVWPN